MRVPFSSWRLHLRCGYRTNTCAATLELAATPTPIYAFSDPTRESLQRWFCLCRLSLSFPVTIRQTRVPSKQTSALCGTFLRLDKKPCVVLKFASGPLSVHETTWWQLLPKLEGGSTTMPSDDSQPLGSSSATWCSFAIVANRTRLPTWRQRSLSTGCPPLPDFPICPDGATSSLSPLSREPHRHWRVNNARSDGPTATMNDDPDIPIHDSGKTLAKFHP